MGGLFYGLILSDAWLHKHSNDHVRLGFKQSLKHFEYFWFTFSQLTHYCAGYPSTTTNGRGSKTFYGIQIYNRSFYLLSLTFTIDFNPFGAEVIPDDIYNILTPVALAHLIMGMVQFEIMV